MINMYIDESGSIHQTSEKLNRYFIIGIIIPKQPIKLKRVYKLFIRKNIDYMRKIDIENKMFNKLGKFIELKGSSMDRKLKLDFISFFCKNNLFEVRYIILDNNQLDERFIKNKARTFNYLIKLFLINSLKKGYIKDKEIFLQIDERNVKTESKFSLEDYLNKELILNDNILEDVKVKYFDSSENCFVQIADVFSNIMYSSLITNSSYKDELRKLQQEKYILPAFIFPKKKFENNIKKI